MPIRNNHWYDLNDQRKYPLSDTASGVSDAGERLPASLLADLRLRWPRSYGRYGFLSSCAVGPRLVTVLFAATPELDDPDAPVTLLAGYTGLRSETQSGRAFSLQSFCPGAGGFVVFGSIPDVPYSGRFSRPSQSLLSSRAAWGVRRPPIRTLGVEHAAQAFSRLVQLSADLPLEIVKESRVIEGVLQQDVLVFRLQAQAQPLQLATRSETVLAEFAGPCGARVGTGTCGDPQPIVSINGVSPDCDGIITLDFRSCAVVGKNAADCGVVLDCAMSLDQVCAPPYLPALDTGELPYETIIDLVIPPVLPPPPPPPPGDVSVSLSVIDVLDLPYCESFDTYGSSPLPPDHFTFVGNSSFNYVVDDSPEALCGETSGDSASASSASDSASTSVSSSASASVSDSGSASASSSASASVSTSVSSSASASTSGSSSYSNPGSSASSNSSYVSLPCEYNFMPEIEWKMTLAEVYDPSLPVSADQIIATTVAHVPDTLRFKKIGALSGGPEDQLDFDNLIMTSELRQFRTLQKTYQGYNDWDREWTGNNVFTWGAQYTSVYDIPTVGGGAPPGTTSVSFSDSSCYFTRCDNFILLWPCNAALPGWFLSPTSTQLSALWDGSELSQAMYNCFGPGASQSSSAASPSMSSASSISDPTVSYSYPNDWPGPPPPGSVVKRVMWDVRIYKDPKTIGWLVRGVCRVWLNISPRPLLTVYSTEWLLSASIFNAPATLHLDDARDSTNPAYQGIAIEAATMLAPTVDFGGLRVEADIRWDTAMLTEEGCAPAAIRDTAGTLPSRVIDNGASDDNIRDLP